MPYAPVENVAELTRMVPGAGLMEYSWTKALRYFGHLDDGRCSICRACLSIRRFVEPGSAWAKPLKLMQRRLLKAIMNPAMIRSWEFRAVDTGGKSGFAEIGLVKLAAVARLTGCHIVLRMRRQLEANDHSRSDRFCGSGMKYRRTDDRDCDSGGGKAFLLRLKATFRQLGFCIAN